MSESYYPQMEENQIFTGPTKEGISTYLDNTSSISKVIIIGRKDEQEMGKSGLLISEILDDKGIYVDNMLSGDTYNLWNWFIKTSLINCFKTFVVCLEIIDEEKTDFFFEGMIFF